MSLKILPSFTKQTNCEIPHIDDHALSNDLDCSSLIVASSSGFSANQMETRKETNQEDDVDDYFDDDDIEAINFDLDENLLELNSRRYFAGYVLHMKIKETNCENCRSLLIKPTDDLLTSDSESLIKNKNFFLEDIIKLNAPSNLYFDIVSYQVKLFVIFFKNLCFQKNVKKRIIELCLSAIITLNVSIILNYI